MTRNRGLPKDAKEVIERVSFLGVLQMLNGHCHSGERWLHSKWWLLTRNVYRNGVVQIDQMLTPRTSRRIA